MDIPPQDSFLYKGKWSPNTDDMLLTTALSMKNTDPHWLGTDVPDQVLFEAGVRIERELGCQLTPTDLKDRVQALEIHYHTFKALVAFPGVRWDFKWKFVEAIDTTWKEILKIHPDADAYYYQDEPGLILRLASLFGLDDVKVEGDKTVIIITDSTYLLHSPCGQSEEVNLPVFEDTKVRRKLFDEALEIDDCESAIGKPPHYYVPCPEGGGGMVPKVGHSTPHVHLPSRRCLPPVANHAHRAAH